MKKVAHWLLMAVVGLGAFYGVKALKQEAMGAEPLDVQAAKQLTALQEEAARTHPNMAKTDAIKAVALEKSAQKLAGLDSADKRANAAADMFFGYFFLNTKARNEFCRARGVDISAFVDAFTAKNTAELARAEAIYAQAGVDPNENWQKMQGQFTSFVEQDMKDVAAGAEVPTEEACALFAENGELFAQHLPLSPDVRRELMSPQSSR